MTRSGVAAVRLKLRRAKRLAAAGLMRTPRSPSSLDSEAPSRDKSTLVGLVVSRTVARELDSAAACSGVWTVRAGASIACVAWGSGPPPCAVDMLKQSTLAERIGRVQSLAADGGVRHWECKPRTFGKDETRMKRRGIDGWETVEGRSEEM